jgi:hypothetical protein
VGGYALRSGAAEGSDSYFEGCSTNAFNEIYLPKDGFNGRNGDCRGAIDARYLPNYQKARRIASKVVSHWNSIQSDFALQAHTRNIYQVLGLDLDSPSDFLVCCAPPLKGKPFVDGGTNTAVIMAFRNNVPIFNLYNKTYEEFLDWYNNLEVNHRS